MMSASDGWQARWLVLGRSLLRCALCLVASHAPLWLMSAVLSLNRPLVNLDLLFAAAVFAYRRSLGVVALCVAWIVDLTVGLSATYHFLSVDGLLAAVRFIPELGLRGLDVGTGWVRLLPFLAGAWLLVRQVRVRRIDVLVILVLSLALVTADSLNGSSVLSNRLDRLWQLNLAGSPGYTMVKEIQAAYGGARKVARPLPRSETVQGLVDLPAWIDRNPNRAIVFVLVESLGWVENSAIRDWMRERAGIARLEGDYQVKSGSLPFRGATTAAEMRHLCELEADHRSAPRDLSGCLPARLAAAGWWTTGIHGFSSNMFARRSWWSSAGLQHQLFGDDTAARSLPRCGGVFRGVCDADLVREAFRLADARRQFVYLLTLNTHIPLEHGQVPEDLTALCVREAVPVPACQLVAEVTSVLGRVVESAHAQTVKPLVLVVGDHAPPFLERSSRRQFSPSRTPAFAFVPIPAGQASAQIGNVR